MGSTGYLQKKTGKCKEYEMNILEIVGLVVLSAVGVVTVLRVIGVLTFGVKLSVRKDK